jgi:hypothetical protein
MPSALGLTNEQVEVRRQESGAEVRDNERVLRKARINEIDVERRILPGSESGIGD